MFVLSNQLRQLPVRSLQTGQVIATTSDFLIDPSSLQIAAWWCNGPELDNQAILLPRDVRQMGRGGIVVDDAESITELSEVIRVSEIAQKKFRLIGIRVKNESGMNLGKVGDFTLHANQLVIQKLYIKQPLWRNFLVHDLVIDRSQIIDVTPKQITVRDGVVKTPAFTPQPTLSE